MRPESGIPDGYVAQLVHSFYGLRDAGKAFGQWLERTLVEFGFRPGVYSPAVFFHPARKTRFSSTAMTLFSVLVVMGQFGRTLS